MIKRTINLMPKDYKSKHAFNYDVALIGSILLIFFYMGFQFFSVKKEGKYLEDQLKQVQAKDQEVNRLISEMSFSDENEKLQQMREKLIQQVMGKNLKWSQAFKEISHLVPKNTWLTDMSAKKNNGKLSLEISGRTTSQFVMASFFQELERSKYFNGLMVQSSENLKDVEPHLFEFKFASQQVASPKKKKEKAK